MDIEQINRQFDEIAGRLRVDDADLIRRTDRLRRREAAHVALVVAFLIAAVLLLATGFALLSPVAWCAGLFAFVAASAADRLLRMT